MADLLEKACTWLGGMQSAHLSHLVTYCRANDSVQVAATVGKTTFDIDDGYGVIERWESRDFLISAAALTLGLPQPGDKVKETSAGGTLVYEVLAPGKEPCWRYSDPYRTTLRIHTKQVE
jgi:hypothetical protein